MSKNLDTVYLAAVSLIFVMLCIFGKCREKSERPEVEEFSTLVVNSSFSSSLIGEQSDEGEEDEHMMIEIQNESEIDMNAGHDELIY